MTLDQFRRAFVHATKNDGNDVSFNSLDIFDGYGFWDFKPVTVTVEDVAALIVWQARRFNGEWDHGQLNEIRDIGRRKFIIAN